MLVKSGKHYRFRVEHTVRHKQYVEWKYQLLKQICLTPPVYIPNHCSVKMSTVGHPKITELRNAWYHKQKHVPVNFRLSPLMLAIWFMDDGTKHRDTVDFSVHSFADESLQILQKQMSQFGIETTINSDGKGARLYVKKHSYPIFKSLVTPYIVECMAYKLP